MTIKNLKEDFSNYCKINRLEINITLPDGSKRTGLFYGQIVSYKNQNCLFQTIVDITQLQSDKNSLLKRSEIIKAIVETSQDWIWSIDEKGIIENVITKVKTKEHTSQILK